VNRRTPVAFATTRRPERRARPAQSHSRRAQRFERQPPGDAFQVLISTVPGHGPTFELLASELTRQGIPFLADDRAGLLAAEKRDALLARVAQAIADAISAASISGGVLVCSCSSTFSDALAAPPADTILPYNPPPKIL
jgi:hypothetical protein